MYSCRADHPLELRGMILEFEQFKLKPRCGKMFQSLMGDATPLTISSDNGQMNLLPNGGSVGWRYLSSSGGATIDLQILNVPIEKIHLP